MVKIFKSTGLVTGIFGFFIFSALPFFALGKIQDTLKNIYTATGCGLNYVQASVRLGKKMAPYGLVDAGGNPLYGADQPAQFVISGIPQSARIERAYIWWDLTGASVSGNVTVKNPAGTTGTFPGTLIGSGGAEKCWGYGAAAFRANVTGIISGNGAYLISGLPTDSTFTQNDVNGASLFIIYSDTSSSYTGTLMINDGYFMVKFDTVTQTINAINAPDTSNLARAFMLVSDLQNEFSGSSLKMNNGPYAGITIDFWDFEERATVVTGGQTTSTFGIRSPNDCCNYIMGGLYYQYNTDTASPVITANGDSLLSTPAVKYQWFLNGIGISGAQTQVYVAMQAGNYTVAVDHGAGCFFASAITTITCIQNFKPVVVYSGSTLTANAGFSSYQWYKDSAAISGANNFSYPVTDTGKYWVQVIDSAGCIYISDTVSINLLGLDNLYKKKPFNIAIYPNPGSGQFSVEITTAEIQDITIILSDIQGRALYYEPILKAAGVIIRKIGLEDYPAGFYIVKVISKQGVAVQKIAVLGSSVTAQ